MDQSPRLPFEVDEELLERDETVEMLPCASSTEEFDTDSPFILD